MTARRFFAFTALALSATLAGCGNAPAVPADQGSGQATASIDRMTAVEVISGDTIHRFRVALALTPHEQERGLMFRQSLPDNGGMLFPFTPPRTASFWMKDTAIPLDIIFIKTDGSVAYIAENVEPFSREPKSAAIPVLAVLEVAGGTTRRLGIREGDVVRWGHCTAQRAALPELFCP